MAIRNIQSPRNDLGWLDMLAHDGTEQKSFSPVQRKRSIIVLFQSAVDAIKFTLDNKSKENTSKVEVAKISEGIQSNGESNPIPVETLSPQELKQMLSKAKDSEDDDCLMCGS